MLRIFESIAKTKIDLSCGLNIPRRLQTPFAWPSQIPSTTPLYELEVLHEGTTEVRTSVLRGRLFLTGEDTAHWHEYLIAAVRDTG